MFVVTSGGNVLDNAGQQTPYRSFNVRFGRFIPTVFLQMIID